MQALGTTVRAILDAHPALAAQAARGVSPVTPQERMLIDEMLASALGLGFDRRSPSRPREAAAGEVAPGAGAHRETPATNCPGPGRAADIGAALDDRRPSRLRWWIRERRLVVAVTDQSLFTVGRFMLRELGHQLATLGHPGGATSVKFLCWSDEPTAPGSASGPAKAPTVDRQPSAAAARHLRIAADQVDDPALTKALQRLAARLDPAS